MSCKHINKQQEEQLGNDVGKVFVQVNKFSENKHVDDDDELPSDPNDLPMIVHMPPLEEEVVCYGTHVYSTSQGVRAFSLMHSKWGEVT